MKNLSQLSSSFRRLALALSVSMAATSSFAADQTITGNLTVTGTTDIDGNSLALGTQSSSPGLLLTYADASVDTLTFYLNRNPGSFLWAHTTAIAAMRLTGNHELVLYKSDGSTAGLTLTPATNTISLGATTLYRDSTSGALRTNGALTVDGSFSAPSFVTSNGTVTGGATGLALQAGGSNQNITVTPSGTGNVVLNGKVGIGTTPTYKLDVAGDINFTGTLRQSGTPFLPTQWLTTGSVISYGAGSVRVGGSTTDGVFGAGAVGTADNGSFEVFSSPTDTASLPGESWYTQSVVRGVASDANKNLATAFMVSQEVASTGTRNGFYAIAYTPPSYSGSVNRIRAIMGAVRHTSTSAVGNLHGGLFFASNVSTGSVGTLTGFSGTTENLQGTVGSLRGINASLMNGGTSTDVTGIDVFLTNSGTISNVYGIYIGNLSGGTVTNAVYALRSVDANARAYFAGPLQAEGAIRLGGAAASAAAWGTTGAQLEVKAATITDSSTAASGTASTAVFNSFAAPTLAATNAGVTTTQAATVYIAGNPTAGANQTISKSYGLWNAGKTRLDGAVRIAPQGDLSMGTFTSEP